MKDTEFWRCNAEGCENWMHSKCVSKFDGEAVDEEESYYCSDCVADWKDGTRSVTIRIYKHAGKGEARLQEDKFFAAGNMEIGLETEWGEFDEFVRDIIDVNRDEEKLPDSEFIYTRKQRKKTTTNSAAVTLLVPDSFVSQIVQTAYMRSSTTLGGSEETTFDVVVKVPKVASQKPARAHPKPPPKRIEIKLKVYHPLKICEGIMVPDPKKALDIDAIEIQRGATIPEIKQRLLLSYCSQDLTKVADFEYGHLYGSGGRAGSDFTPILESNELWKPASRFLKGTKYHKIAHVALQASQHELDVDMVKSREPTMATHSSPISEVASPVPVEKRKGSRKASRESRTTTIMNKLLELYLNEESFLYHAIHQGHLAILLSYFVSDHAKSSLMDCEVDSSQPPKEWPSSAPFLNQFSTGPKKGAFPPEMNEERPPPAPRKKQTSSLEDAARIVVDAIVRSKNQEKWTTQGRVLSFLDTIRTRSKKCFKAAQKLTGLEDTGGWNVVAKKLLALHRAVYESEEAAVLVATWMSKATGYVFGAPETGTAFLDDFDLVIEFYKSWGIYGSILDCLAPELERSNSQPISFPRQVKIWMAVAEIAARAAKAKEDAADDDDDDDDDEDEDEEDEGGSDGGRKGRGGGSEGGGGREGDEGRKGGRKGGGEGEEGGSLSDGGDGGKRGRGEEGVGDGGCERRQKRRRGGEGGRGEGETFDILHGDNFFG